MPVHDGSQMGKEFEKKFGKDIVYNYGCKENKFDFYVYRVTKLNYKNVPVDLSYDDMVEFCKKNGLKTPMLLKKFIVSDAREVQSFVKEEIEKYEDPQFPSIPREGVVVRIEANGKTSFFKEKTFAFKVLEGYQTFKEDDSKSE